MVGLIIGTFRLSNYDTPSQPLNTVFSAVPALEEGLTRATAEEQISAGLRRVIINLNILHIMVIVL